MGSREEHEVVIVGGGIVGLATALALHRKGIQSLVLEKSDTLRATGSGIGVFINGWRALDQLGVSRGLQMQAIPLLEIHDAWLNSNRIRLTPCSLKIPTEALRCLKRSDLVEALANELPVNAIRFGCQVVAIGEDPLTSFPIIHAGDGNTIKAKVLIGCDGSNSIVGKLLGLKAPRLFPMYSIRAFTKYPNGHNCRSNVFRIRGDQIMFGRIPIDDKSVYWFVCWGVHLTDLEVDKVPQHIRELALDLLKEFPADVIEMVRYCDVDSLTLNHIRYRDLWNLLFENLWKGTSTVTGDAMHLMGPYLGQGGSCGLEDAVVLASCLARGLHSGPNCEIDDQKKRIGVALDAYVKERRLRVVRLSAQSYVVGSLILASSWIRKEACIAVLVIFFGGMSLSHSRYNCGHL